MRMTGLSFNSAVVIRSMDPVKRAALSRAGASVRLRAKRSMRKRKGTSRPGKPPHAHVGTLRRLLFYAWDPAADSVVVGPLRFGEGGAPALEYGGTIRVKSRSRGTRGTARRVRTRIEARPFMGPAKKEVEPLMAGFWAQAAVKQRGR